MKNLYDCISRGGLGVFESPTGTVGAPIVPSRAYCKGKSMSIICGAFKWLRELDTQQQQSPDHMVPETPQQAAVQAQAQSSVPSWVEEFLVKQAADDVRFAEKLRKEALEKRLKRVQAAKEAIELPQHRFKKVGVYVSLILKMRAEAPPRTDPSLHPEPPVGGDVDDQDLLPTDSTSDDEDHAKQKQLVSLRGNDGQGP
jgi:Rad3-related DNA helicase